MLRTCLVLADETVEFLHSGCSLVVGIVDDDGAPVASRGWGLTVLEPDGSRLRMIGVEGEVALGPVAVTACSVPTLRSMQFKGSVVVIEAMTEADQAKSKQYTDDFMQDIIDTDGVPRHLLERIIPLHRVALHRPRRRNVRPDAGPARRCAAVVSDHEVSVADLRLCFEGAVPAVIATASAAGVPNITYLSRVRYVDDEHVALSNQFFSKTVRNLAENPRASMLLVDPTTFDEFRLTLVFERTVKKGPIFQKLREDVEEAAAHHGMQDVFKLRAADLFRVLDIERHGDPKPLAVVPPDDTRGPVTRPAGLSDLVARLSRCPDLDTLVGATVDGLDELLGYRALAADAPRRGRRSAVHDRQPRLSARRASGPRCRWGRARSEWRRRARRRSASATSARCGSTRRR